MSKFNTDQPWWTSSDGKRCKILAISEIDGMLAIDVKGHGTELLYASGTMFQSPARSSPFDLITHLPDCTGWDWEPIQPSPGYRLLLPGEPIDRSSGSKHQACSKVGTMPRQWWALSNTLATQCSNYYYYQCPIEPKPIDAGEGWRLLEVGEIRKHGDEYFEQHGVWKSTNDVGTEITSTSYVYRRRIKPPIDLGEGWRLLEDSEPLQEYDQVHSYSDQWRGIGNARYKCKGEVFRRRIELTYIPWTRETCPLGGFIFDNNGTDVGLILSRFKDHCTVLTSMDARQHRYNELLEFGLWTHNGKPCGTPGVKT